MDRTQVQSLVWEDLTSHTATKPVGYSIEPVGQSLGAAAAKPT